jgi:hypothetical protein
MPPPLKKPMKKDQELIAITETYDRILWSCNHTTQAEVERNDIA